MFIFNMMFIEVISFVNFHICVYTHIMDSYYLVANRIRFKLYVNRKGTVNLPMYLEQNKLVIHS